MDKNERDHYKKSILTLQKEIKRLNKRIEKYHLLLKDLETYMGRDNYYRFLNLRKEEHEEHKK